jgi:hypothetical protein
MITTKTIISEYIFSKTIITTTSITRNTATTSIHSTTKGGKDSKLCTIRTKIQLYRKQLYILVLIIILWYIYVSVQYQYYYSSETIAAVNRLIRQEALRLEQQREQQQRVQREQHQGQLRLHQAKPILDKELSKPHESIEQTSTQKRTIRKVISPQELLLRHGSSATVLLAQ